MISLFADNFFAQYTRQLRAIKQIYRSFCMKMSNNGITNWLDKGYALAVKNSKKYFSWFGTYSDIVSSLA